MNILYCGAVGEKNIGDEAILLANRQLLPEAEFTIARSEDENETTATLLGGGTTLPYSLLEDSGYNVNKSENNYCLGVGVADPDLFKSCYSNVDIRWLAEKKGWDIDSVFEKTGIFGKGMQVFLNNIYDPFYINRRYYSDENYRSISKFGFDDISVRGPSSRRILLQYGINSDIVGDPALYLEPDSYITTKTGKIVLCIHGEGKRWSSNQGYIDELISFCKSIDDDHTFVLLPFHPSNVDKSNMIAKQLPNAEVIDYASSRNITAILNKISSADLIIGERLHANILSAACYTPFISLEYNPKNRDFAESIEYPELNIRVDHMTEEKIYNLYSYIMSNRNIIIENIKYRVNTYRRKLEDKSSYISRDIEKSG